ncbi:PucR family transcriptional regulator [Paenibacillus sp. P46E]|uniref:PucR family transcriptional regulator n=1 Tax=Paenibacillus sp. P46E TaxID=1349436 RepID=UPI00093C8109|nr:PucR family transcriptional regulator [Paenibacillus sp. P46E]OKP95157.1 hypothetical protein A3849_27480 [Paenibacillus sp. P46E]
MSFRTLKQLRLVAGETGLDRVVTWPYIVQTNSVKMWIFGGELLFFGGLGLKCDMDSLVELLKEAAEKNASGIIFLANDEMTSEVIQSLKPYADDLRMPVFELPRESIIVEITKEISSKILEEESRTSITEHLLERLCFGDTESVHEWVSKAGYYGIDLNIPYQVAVLYIDNLSGYLNRMNMEWDHSFSKFISFYRQVVVSIVKRYDDSLLTMYSNNVVYLAQQTGPEQDQMRFVQKLQWISESINTYFKGIDVYACLGGAYPYSALKNSYLEAERSMEITCRQNDKNRVSLYEDLGVYQLFFSLKEEELRRFCSRWIGSLVEYDHKNGTELFRTLDIFFTNKMNLIDSAAELYIHRNTLNIRLNRIEKIIGKSLKDTDTLHSLLFGVLIKNYLDRKTA